MQTQSNNPMHLATLDVLVALVEVHLGKQDKVTADLARAALQPRVHALADFLNVAAAPTPPAPAASPLSDTEWGGP